MYTGARLAGAGITGEDGPRRRLLAWAVLCSLALHALILSFLPWFREIRETRLAPPLTAHLAKPKPPPPPVQADPAPPVPPAAPIAKAAARRPAPVPVPA